MVDNQVVTVSNYATDALQDTLDKYAENGYRLEIIQQYKEGSK